MVYSLNRLFSFCLFPYLKGTAWAEAHPTYSPKGRPVRLCCRHTSSSAPSRGSSRYWRPSATRPRKGATRTTPSSWPATWAAALDQGHRLGIRHNFARTRLSGKGVGERGRSSDFSIRVRRSKTRGANQGVRHGNKPGRNIDRLAILDGNLEAGSPLKSDDTNKQISLSTWVRLGPVPKGARGVRHGNEPGGEAEGASGGSVLRWEGGAVGVRGGQEKRDAGGGPTSRFGVRVPQGRARSRRRAI